MSRDERRDAIARATVPLLVEHGAQVTTRQIAEAAGVAEGTLFRAFDDKPAILAAAAHRVLDPTAVVAELEGLPPAGSLEQEVTQVVTVLTGTSQRVQRVMVALHTVLAAEGRTHGHGGPGPGDDHVPGRPPFGPPPGGRPGGAPGDGPRGGPDGAGPGDGDARGPHGRDARFQVLTRLRAAVHERLTPYADDLRIEPELFAHLLLGVVMGRTPPGALDDSHITVDQVVDLLLHGAAA